MVIGMEIMAAFYVKDLTFIFSSLHNIYSRKLRIEKKFCLNLKVYSS